MYKVRITAGNEVRQPGSGIAKVQAKQVLDKLKETYDLIESISDEAYAYVPANLLDDLHIAIREMDTDLRR